MLAKNTIPYLTATLAAVIGIGSIIIFTIFIYVGCFHVLLLPFNTIELLCFDAGLCMLFFIQHSIMIRSWFKQISSIWIPANYFGATFAITSGIMLLTLIVLWQQSPLAIATSFGWWRWLIRGGFFLVLFIQTWALWSLRAVDLFGIHILVGCPSVASQSESVLIVGAYRWVRHPIYSTSILLLWLYPDLTADRLILNILFTLWIVIGAIYEERDLVAIHGEAYQNYQRTVPMLIPNFNIAKPK